MEDCEIISRFEQRDEVALFESKQKYGASCLSIANRILGNPEDAEECVQDTWVQAWNSIPPDKPVHLFAYFARITRNFAIDLLRKKKTAKRGGNYGSVTYDELAECLPGGVRPEDELDCKTTAAAISCFLRTLSERDRNLFIRRYFYVQPIQYLAQRYGMSANHVSAVLYRTRGKLAKYLEKEGICG